MILIKVLLGCWAALGAGEAAGLCPASAVGVCGGLLDDATSDSGLGLVQKALHYATRQLGTAKIHRSSTKPLSVFVYDLPSEKTVGSRTIVYRDTCRSSAPHECPETRALGSDDEMTALFGYPIDVSPNEGKTVARIRATDQFALGRIFLASLQQHPQRTADPSTADLFFVPAFNEVVHPPLSQCPSAEDLTKDLPHLTERTADRHFWLAPNIAWGNNTCDIFNAKFDDPSPALRLLALVNKLALEDEVCAPMSLRAEARYGDAILGDEYLPPTAEHLHAIPYPSTLSGLNEADLRAWKAVVSGQQERRWLASAMWGMHGLPSTLKMRTTLKRQCKQDPRCSFEDLHFSPTDNNVDAVMSSMLQATFCLEPTGDSVSRKGMVDAIIAGCIPVLFSPLQARCWPWHVNSWSDVAIEFDSVPHDVMAELAKVTAADVAERRAAMARMVDGLTYSRPGQPRTGDALDITLKKLLSLRG